MYLDSTVVSQSAKSTQLLVQNSQKKDETWSTLSLVYWPPEMVAKTSGFVCPNTDNCVLLLDVASPGVLTDPSVILVFLVSALQNAVFLACDRQIRYNSCDGAHSLPQSP